MNNETLHIVLAAVFSAGGLQLIQMLVKGIRKWKSGRAAEERAERKKAIQKRRDISTLAAELDDYQGAYFGLRNQVRAEAPHIILPPIPAPREYEDLDAAKAEPEDQE